MKFSHLFSVPLSLAICAANAETPASNYINPDIVNVHNRCIVQFSPDMASDVVQGLAKNMARQAKAELSYVYRYSIKGFTVKLPCHAARSAFRHSTDIISMSADTVVYISKGKPSRIGDDPDLEQQVSYGTPRVGGGLIDSANYTAWVIDSGVDLNHPDLNVDSSRGFTAIKRGEMDDQHGHGTHVAGIIGAIDNSTGSLGVAPNTRIVPVRVLDRRGSGTMSGVIAGVDHVAENASAGDCVNMSLGGGAYDVLDQAVVTAAANTGAYFVLAAGNEGKPAELSSPARANGINVYTISAVDDEDVMASWSNYGEPPVDFSAPGVAIFSTWKNGGTNTISGTSMAAPHACAAIMLSGGTPASSGGAKNDPDGKPDPIIYID